jgi:hypothetical protein
MRVRASPLKRTSFADMVVFLDGARGFCAGA